MRIAIMQPYFIPYAGYFRLFAATDLFVIYDCVQFIRRGWIHRNQLPDQHGELNWLTLPLVKAPQDTVITQLSFASDAQERMHEQMRKFPLFNTALYLESEWHPLLTSFTSSPITYMVQLLKAACTRLALPCQIAFSSELKLPAELKGQDRIIAIAKYFKADTYINAPGGRSLYNENDFQQNHLKLQFLSGYTGSTQSILPRLLNEDLTSLRREIVSQSIGM